MIQLFWAALAILILYVVCQMPRSPLSMLLAGFYVALYLCLMFLNPQRQISAAEDWPDFLRGIDAMGAAFILGVPDEKLLSILWPIHSQRDQIVEFLRQRRMAMFDEPRASWPGRNVSELFSRSGVGRCIGATERVSALPDEQSWRVEGWAWDNSKNREIDYVLIADPAGQVVGIARGGFRHGYFPGFFTESAVSPIYHMRFRASEWLGYARQPREDSLDHLRRHRALGSGMYHRRYRQVSPVMTNYLAVDIGAESGRVMHGNLADGQLRLEELHRFANQPVQLPPGLYWDSFRLFYEMVEGLTVAGRERNLRVDGIGVDTWGVDFGLLGGDGGLIDCPRHYRDARTHGVMERLFRAIPREEVFEQTGIQFMAINSLNQLYAMRLENARALECAERLLFIPDLLNYWLTGVARAEVTIASTSQFYNPRTRAFCVDMLERLGIPARILPELIEPGSLLGRLLPKIAERTGLGAAPVFASAGHDTASAVAAVPAEGDDWCYISSGTWSLMGVELPAPVIDARSLELNYTNEAGVGGRTRLLKNIAGLWILQECRRSWADAGELYTYEELARMAEASGPAKALIDPGDFLEPGDMPSRIAAWLRSRGLPQPASVGETCRIVLESLAERYRQVLEGLESLAGRKIRAIHIVGGGSKHSLLNRLVARATGRIVYAGPVEAAAAGNILVQAMGAGAVRNLEEAREVVRRSFEIEKFEPNS